MGLYEGRLFNPALWLALLTVAIFSSGCQTPTTSLFTAAGPGWRVQEGQALWRPQRGYPELAGDLVAVTDQNGRCLLQFSKTPVTLVTAQVTRTNWLIQFPPQELFFTGRGKPPTRFAWLYLHSALSGESLPSDFQFQRKTDGGWRLENTRSGETLEGYLEP